MCVLSARGEGMKPCLHLMMRCISLCRLPRTRRQTTMEPIVKLVCGLVLLAAASAPSPAQSPAGRAPEVKAAVDGALGLFQQKPVVVLCDQHGLAQEEDFYSALVRDPRFAENVGNVIVEFGGEASQGIIDRYVAGEDVPLKELRRVWTQIAGWRRSTALRCGWVSLTSIGPKSKPSRISCLFCCSATTITSALSATKFS